LFVVEASLKSFFLLKEKEKKLRMAHKRKEKKKVKRAYFSTVLLSAVEKERI